MTRDEIIKLASQAIDGTRSDPEDDQLNCIVAAIRARSIQPPKGGDKE